MKLKLLIINFLFFSSFAFGQNIPLLFDEDFNDPNSGWNIEDDDESETYMKSGNFYMYNKTKSSYYFYWNSYDFEMDKDFMLETDITLTYGKEDDYAGVIFCGYGVDDAYSFSLSMDGKYRVAVNEDGEMEGKWEKTDVIKPKGQTNKIKVEKINNRLSFYINGTLVRSTKYQGSFGDDFGFILSSSAKAYSTFYKIYGIRPKINIVDNPIMNPKENLGAGINTKYEELHPVISPDGKTMYFVRDDYPRNIGDPNTNDIWVSKFNGNTWGRAFNIERPINNDGNNAVIAVTPDNNRLILKARYTAFGEELGSGFSYSTKNNDGTWSIPKNIDVDNYYNDGDYSSFALSTDLQVLILDIERSDNTYGQNDLYVSFRNSDGTYSEPKNLGNVVNTADEEGTPFLAADGRTLYFSSYGHAGYGSSDIFVTKRLDNTWTNWTTPLNLGPGINTDDWDAYFTLDASGEYAYLVSSANGYGEEDIFRIKLQEELQPDPVVIIYGKVLDKKTNLPLSSDIKYDDFLTNEEIGVAISNGQDGTYKIVLPCGKKYGFFAQKSGYFALSDNIDLTNITEYTEIERDLYLVPIQQNNDNNNTQPANNKIVLNNIFFQRGKAELLPTSYPELDRLVQMMNDNSDLEIEIQGHTNNVGDHDLLVELSEQRAVNVKNYLIQKGISANRISTKGYGPDNPIADNSTQDGRTINQRVEFLIINQ